MLFCSVLGAAIAYGYSLFQKPIYETTTVLLVNGETKGISNDQVAVIATVDRAGQSDLSVATLGRIKKIDIDSSIGKRISQKTILCTD